MTPEELCDIVEQYADILQVQWNENSSGLSVNTTYVTLFNKGKAGENIALYGLFPFASVSDAKQYCYDISEHPKHLIGQIERLYGIQGKFATNFNGSSHSNWVEDYRYKKEKDIDAFNLWLHICRKRETLGISSDTKSKKANRQVAPAKKPVAPIGQTALTTGGCIVLLAGLVITALTILDLFNDAYLDYTGLYIGIGMLVLGSLAFIWSITIASKKAATMRNSEPFKSSEQQSAPAKSEAKKGTSITLWAQDEATAKQLGTDRYYLMGALIGDSSSITKNFLEALDKGGSLTYKISSNSVKEGYNVELTITSQV